MLERSLRMISFTARKPEERVLGKWYLTANLQVNSRRCQPPHFQRVIFSLRRLDAPEYLPQGRSQLQDVPQVCKTKR